jgi:heme-degrading monooxygenase HmoA
MSVVMQHRVPGMTKEQYRQVLATSGDALTVARGFRAHYGVFDDAGIFTAVEVWDTEDDHNRFYDEYIRPFVAAGTPAPEFAQIEDQIIR